MLKALKGVNYSKELLKTHKQFSFKVRRMQIWVKGKEKKNDDRGQGRMPVVRSGNQEK